MVALIVTQRDIARLSDNDIKRMILGVVEQVDGVTGPYPAPGAASFWQVFVVAMFKAMRERTMAFAVMATDAINEDGPGAVVGPGDDPVADTLEELGPNWRIGGLE